MGPPPIGDLRRCGAPSTKRAELGGDSESFAMKRRRRAQPGKPADEGPKPERSRSSAVWPVFANKIGAPWLTRRPERISKSKISASANVGKFEVCLLRGC